MSAHEVITGFKWIASVLSGDSTFTTLAPGGIYRGLAPVAVTAPFVSMVHQSGMDSVVFQGGRAYSNILYQVKVVGLPGASQQIADAAARLDVLLTDATQIAVTNGTIMASFRYQPLQQDEVDPSHVQWMTLGGLYRIMVKGS